MPAILFGSIGTLADTSELQRDAFNRAFEAHGLAWHWDREDYQAMLQQGGGANRIDRYASSVGATVDAAAVHRSKSEIFRSSLADADLAPRPGVAETIRGARTEGLKVALVTTTSTDNVSAVMAALSPGIQVGDFDLITDVSSVDSPKPDRAAYSFALDTLGEDPAHCVAIEDNVDGVRAAVAAGLECVAFPGSNNAGHDFRDAQRVVERLDLGTLQAEITGKDDERG